MATRKKSTTETVEITEVTEDVYMSKYDKISEEKFAELEARLEKLEEFERQAKSIKGWFPTKWN